ncbi:hypothetical protein AGMMS49965_15020 [Bacteroidia bacterium]|nr:hypothetical protein AGMMS49965_15020 [Bacteroidia bacterium]
MDNTQRFLIESMTSEIVGYIMEDRQVDLLNALEQFYNSPVARLIEDTSNLLYRQGSAYVYEKYFKGGE